MTERNKYYSNLLKMLVWVFPILFLVDNILGFNGYQFTIAGKSIRIILFSISIAVLCVYCIGVMIKEGISLLPAKNERKTLWKMLRPLDYIVLFFIVGNLIWATLVPLLVRGDMIFSLKDYSTILVLVLYFPLAFLIRTNRLGLKLLEKMVYVLTIILALWHCVMYIGDSIHSGFYESYYDLIDIISFGTAVRSNVVYGYGIIRVIQTTSLFLLPGIFMSLKYLVNGKWWHIISLIIFTFAVCVTYTKSIWFGYVAGLFIYIISGIVAKKEKIQRLRRIISLGIAIVIIFVLNFAVFGNTLFDRALNTMRSSEYIEEMQQQMNEMLSNSHGTVNTDKNTNNPDNNTNNPDDNTNNPDDNANNLEDINNKLKDLVGTQQANALRSEQNKALMKKWSQSKWFGFGYGSYNEECIRNSNHPYMYESTLLAILMKIGLIGCLVWVIFICGATTSAAKTFWREERDNLFYWLGLAISYAMAVQTNPFLFTFAGMSILLYLLIILQKKTLFDKE